MSRIKEFNLPDLGEGLTEGEILKWLVEVGDDDRAQPADRRGGDGEGGGRDPGEVGRQGHRDLPRRGRRRSRSARRSSRSTPTRRRRAATCRRPPAVGGLAGRGRDRAGRGRGRARADRWCRRPAAHGGAGRLRPEDRPRPSAGPARTARRGSGCSRSAGARRAGSASSPLRAGPAGRRVRRSRRRRTRRPVALAKPPVRKLAQDLGVDLATLTGSGPAGLDHPRRRAAGRQRRRRAAAAPAVPAPVFDRRARAADPGQGRPQAHRREHGGRRRSPRRTSPSSSPST